MKKIIPLLLLLFTTVVFSQETKEKINYKTITQKECVKKKGYRLVLKQVISDSRCPEGVSCIWQGEVRFVVSVYKDKKFVQDETFSSQQKDEYLEKFSKYLGKKVTLVGVLPYPKEGVSIDPKNYVLKIGYVK